MKILVLASTLDLTYRLGCTPAWWQLLKAFHETGNEVVAVPYLGDPVESLWWRTYENPCSTESKLANRATRSTNGQLNGKTGLSKKVSDALIRAHVKPKWRRHLHKVLTKEKDVDLVFMMNIPLNHFTGLPTMMRDEYGVKVAYYDGDMPTILPKYAHNRGFKFSYYEGADLTEYDAYFSNSKGVIPDLEEMGATNVHPLYYGADPQLFQPVHVEQDYDVSFYGYGNQLRERWMTELIAKPSEAMPGTRFVAGGGGFTIPLGRAEMAGDVPYAAFGTFVGRSKINLNITRESHTTVYASATARPFELAAYGACVLSQPYEGMDEWFTPGKEFEMVKDPSEVLDVMRGLLDDPDRRATLGRNIRRAAEERHTYKHRAKEVLQAIPQ